ncbi:MAG: hypothetical protein HY268_31505 [Deltaproteobacteria bacterium]|nr:hypothetical protein [Deltaproteobacteria bacterium]
MKEPLEDLQGPLGEAEQSQKELERRVFHLKALYDVSQVIGSLRDTQQIMKNLLTMVMGTFGTPRGIGVLIDLQRNRVEAVAHRGIEKSPVDLFSQVLEPTVFQETKGISSVQIIPVGEQVEGNDKRKLFEILSFLQIRIWVPFAVNEYFQGGLGLGDKLSGDPYSAEDHELLSTLASQLTIALDNALAYVEIKQLNRGLEEKVRQRTEELRLQHEKLREVNLQLELHNRFIRTNFGRYVSDEVVANLLESPEGLQLGGEKRKATILMSDLRGFTPLAERLAPEQILSIVNRYLGIMVDVILMYQGTINEFIGDAILVLFGAPIWREDDAQRAVACAVAMQQAMGTVNIQNRREGLPEVEMGIGVHTGEVVVGNIGSPRRMQYSVLGSPVNLASRIESYTIGGQILISESTQREIGPILKIERQMEIEAKGIGKPVILYDVRGIGGKYNLFLPQGEEVFLPLQRDVAVRYSLVEEKHLGRTVFEGRLVKLSIKGGEIRSDYAVPLLSDIKIQILDLDGEQMPGDFYGKVVEQLWKGYQGFAVRFTSISSEALLLKILRDAQ